MMLSKCSHSSYHTNVVCLSPCDMGGAYLVSRIFTVVCCLCTVGSWFSCEGD